MEKKYRGKVGVSENKGRLRITIPKSVSGKAGTYLNLGLSADKAENWKVAQAKASLLESDILYEKVDKTYDRYQTDTSARLVACFTYTALCSGM